MKTQFSFNALTLLLLIVFALEYRHYLPGIVCAENAMRNNINKFLTFRKHIVWERRHES